MTRFSAITLDLSRFPAPLAIRGLDHRVFVDERLTRFAELCAERGIPFNVQMLETDPAVILEETDAYRELLAYAAINDAVRAGLVAFAVGSDLEHLAAFYGLERRNVNGTPESDAELRRRTLLAPEAFATAGTHGGYLFHALTSDTRVINADIWTPAPGHVEVAVQAREGLAGAPSDVLAAVREHLHRRDIKPLTDVVTVRSVTTHDYSIDAIVYVRPGPDPMAVKTLVADSLSVLAASRRVPGRDVPTSAVIAAATVGPVDRVVLREPLADVVMQPGQLAICTGIAVEVRTHDG